MSNELYATAEARFDTIVGNNLYFNILKKARIEFDAKKPQNISFAQYMSEHYGIKIQITNLGVLPEFHVLDPNKYTLAVLKFSG
jgi:hypothetical protein